MPTAEFLGKYYNELLEQGLPEALIIDIIRDLALALRENSGVQIKSG